MSRVRIVGPLSAGVMFMRDQDWKAMTDWVNTPEDPAAALVTLNYPVCRPISEPTDGHVSHWFAHELESGKFARHQPPPPPESRKPKKERVKKVAARKKRRGW
jgi:hypothetical protein